MSSQVVGSPKSDDPDALDESGNFRGPIMSYLEAFWRISIFVLCSFVAFVVIFAAAYLCPDIISIVVAATTMSGR